MKPRTRRQADLVQLAAGLLAVCLVAGCQPPAEVSLRREIGNLRETIKQKDTQLVAQKASLDELDSQLRVARSISEDDLKRIFYPEKLLIDRSPAGRTTTASPATTASRSISSRSTRTATSIKVAGDIPIQLYDLAAPPQQNFIGEY